MGGHGGGDGGGVVVADAAAALTAAGEALWDEKTRNPAREWRDFPPFCLIYVALDNRCLFKLPKCLPIIKMLQPEIDLGALLEGRWALRCEQWTRRPPHRLPFAAVGAPLGAPTTSTGHQQQQGPTFPCLLHHPSEGPLPPGKFSAALLPWIRDGWAPPSSFRPIGGGGPSLGAPSPAADVPGKGISHAARAESEEGHREGVPSSRGPPREEWVEGIGGRDYDLSSAVSSSLASLKESRLFSTLQEENEALGASLLWDFAGPYAPDGDPQRGPYDEDAALDDTEDLRALVREALASCPHPTPPQQHPQQQQQQQQRQQQQQQRATARAPKRADDFGGPPRSSGASSGGPSGTPGGGSLKRVKTEPDAAPRGSKGPSSRSSRQGEETTGEGGPWGTAPSGPPAGGPPSGVGAPPGGKSGKRKRESGGPQPPPPPSRPSNKRRPSVSPPVVQRRGPPSTEAEVKGGPQRGLRSSAEDERSERGRTKPRRGAPEMPPEAPPIPVGPQKASGAPPPGEALPTLVFSVSPSLTPDAEPGTRGPSLERPTLTEGGCPSGGPPGARRRRGPRNNLEETKEEGPPPAGGSRAPRGSPEGPPI